jgi:transcriptional regulator PpsR
MSPDDSAGALGTKDVPALLLEANDVCLILDRNGVIRDVSVGSDDATLDVFRSWVGTDWHATASPESQLKIKDLLNGTKDSGRWRQVNHPVEGGTDLPIAWKTVEFGKKGERLAIGRSLRQVSQLQQRLLDAQNSLERDYARLHQAEVRYRMLFSMASEAILFVDADSRKIVEANPAAGRLLDKPVNKLVNRSFPRGFTDNSHDAIEDLMLRVRAAGGAEDLIVKTAHNDQTIRLNAALVRREEGPFYLVRMHAPEHAGQDTNASQILDVINRAPDAFVVTAADGQIQAVNQSFLNLTSMATPLQVTNQPLDRWLGRTGVDVALLIRNLRDRAEIRSYDTTLRPEYGDPIDVELSGVSALDSDQPCLGFLMRRRVEATPTHSDKEAEPELPHSLQEMTELVGRVPLKELVRETTDIIERMCIEAALKMSDQSRASAAEMLGLSRQSLYVKLRRYGIGEDGDASSD